MLHLLPTCPIQLDAQGVWVDLPMQEDEKLFHASIYNLQGRRMTGQLIQAAQASERHHLDFDHTGWPEGRYMLVIKGNKVLRQTKLVK